MTLPEGWAETRLGDVCELLNGRAYKKQELLSQGKYPVLRVGNFFTNDKWYYSDLDLDSEKYCDNGDLLYAWSASFGPRIWAGGKVVYHYHIWRTRLTEEALDKQFLFHWFEWDKENIKTAHGTGTTMIHVTKGDMENRAICLPPLTEQRRIVAKLDALTARLARARAELDRVPVLAAKLRRECLETAFSEEKLAAWTTDQLANVVADGLIGLVRSKAEQGISGAPYLRMGHYDLDGRFNDNEVTAVECSPGELRRFELQAGDVLFNTRNSVELVGKVAIWPADRPGWVFNNNLLRLRFKNDIIPGFAFRYMMSPRFRELMAQKTSATTSVAAIYQRSLYAAPFPVPNGDEQREIVSFVEGAFARADRMEAEAARARALLDRLEAAILARAFRGELVPQDSNDEPASILLDRIRAQRAAAPKAKRGRGKAAA